MRREKLIHLAFKFAKTLKSVILKEIGWRITKREYLEVSNKTALAKPGTTHI